MGDTGSMLIGMVLSVSVIVLMNGQSLKTFFGMKLSPLWPLSLVILPVFDFFRVFLIRSMNGVSPMRPDRNHIHHLFIDRLHFSHKRTTAILSFISVAFISFFYFLAAGATNGSMFVFYAVVFVFCWIHPSSTKT